MIFEDEQNVKIMASFMGVPYECYYLFNLKHTLVVHKDYRRMSEYDAIDEIGFYQLRAKIARANLLYEGRTPNGLFRLKEIFIQKA